MLAFQSRAGKDRPKIALRNEKIMQKWLNLLLVTEFEIFGPHFSYSQINISWKFILTYQYRDWSIQKMGTKDFKPC